MDGACRRCVPLVILMFAVHPAAISSCCSQCRQRIALEPLKRASCRQPYVTLYAVYNVQRLFHTGWGLEHRPPKRCPCPPPPVTGAIMFSTVRSFVHPFVCYQSCKHDISKTYEPMLLSAGSAQGVHEERA